MDSNDKLLSSRDEENDDNSEYLPGKAYYDDRGYSKSRSICTSSRILCLALFLQLVFLLYGTFLFLKSLPASRKYPDIYDGLNLREHDQKMVRHSEYDGRPTPETEQAWHDLLDVGIISITEQEKSRLPFDTARNFLVPDDLRGQLYNPKTIEYDKPVGFWEWHMNHCVESLRNSLMCHADVTPMRYVWKEENTAYALDTGHGHFSCRNWDDIWDFAKSRNTTGDGAINFKAFDKDGLVSGASAEAQWEEANARGGISDV